MNEFDAETLSLPMLDAPTRRKLRRAAAAVFSWILVQAGWLACVGGAGQGNFWIGPLVVTVLVAVHLGGSQHRAAELRLVLIFGAAGTLIESLQSASGLLTFRGAPSAFLCPMWITALWVHFGTLLRPMAEVLRGRLAVAALLGLLGAPFAYWAGVGLGAASFHPAVWPSVLSTGVAWAVALPLGLRWASRVEAASPVAESQTSATSS